MWTVARWRSQGSQTGPPNQPDINPGYVPPSRNDDGHYDGVLGSHTTPTGKGILPPYDIFVGSNNWLFVGGGSQNYGDTFLRCAQRMDLTGSGPWTMRLGFVPNYNPDNNGWSTLYITDQPHPSPSMTSENSHGPIPQYGFAIRLDAAQYFDGTTKHPAPVTLTYNNYTESSEVTDNAHGLPDVPTNVSVDVVITFTRSHVHMTMNGETWYDLDWTLDTTLTSGWVYLGAHNHATLKYAPHSDSRNAVFSYISWDGPTLTPQYSYAVPDALVPTTGAGEGIADPANGVPVPAGINVGWYSPTGALTIPNVPANVNSAKLLLSSKWTPGYPDDGTSYFVRYSLNGHATHDIQTAWKSASGNFAYCSNIDPTELVTGDNTISITLIGQSGSFSPSVGNISLLVESFSTGQIAVGSTVVPKVALGGTDIKLLALGATEIWRAPLPPQVPTAPTLITTLASATVGSLDVRWSQPVARGSALFDFTVQYRVSPSGTWTPFTHTAQTTRTMTLSGLAPLTAYDVRVAAVNGIGTGGWSNVLTATTIGVATAPSQVTGLTTGAITSASVVLTWSVPASGGSPITDYLVQYSSNGGSSYSTFAHGNTTTTETVTGLTTGTPYLFKVSAINAIGTGTASTTASATTAAPPTAPAQVTGLTVGTITNTSVALSWTAPSNGGATITDYKIEYSSNGGSSYSTFAHGSSATSDTVTGLTLSTAYLFRVSALNSVGYGTASTTASATTTSTAAPAVRSFNGSDYLTFSLGAVNNMLYGTVVGIFKKTAAQGGDGYGSWFEPEAGVTYVACYVTDSDHFSYYFRGGGNDEPAGGATVTDGWVLIAQVSFASGVAAQFYKYVFATHTWSQVTGSGAFGVGTGYASSRIAIGAEKTNAEFFRGQIAGVAAWQGVSLTYAQIQTLITNWTAWQALSPTALWVLDQASTATSVTDSTGHGANQTAISGTSVVTNAAPIGWAPTPVEVAADRKTTVGGSTVAAPGHLAIGDVVALSVIGYDSATDTPACSGFTQQAIARRTTGTKLLYIGWLYRVVDGTEPWFAGGTLTVTGVNTNGGYAELFAFRITGATRGLQTTAQASGTSATVTIPAFTTPGVNNLALMIHAGDAFAAPGTVTNWTKLISAFDTCCDAFSRSVPTATTTNSPASYALGGSDAWVSLVVVY